MKEEEPKKRGNLKERMGSFPPLQRLPQLFLTFCRRKPALVALLILIGLAVGGATGAVIGGRIGAVLGAVQGMFAAAVGGFFAKTLSNADNHRK